MAETATPIRNKKNNDKDNAKLVEKFGANAAAVERRVRSAMKLLGDTKRSIFKLTKTPGLDVEAQKDAALEHIEDCRAKLDRIEATIKEIKE